MRLPFAHQPRKQLGQHFLLDDAVIRRLIQAISPHSQDRFCEIGPGLGALTWPLLEWVPRLCVIELDRDLVKRWQQEARVHVVAGDVLKVDVGQLAQTLSWPVSTPSQALEKAQGDTAEQAQISETPETPEKRLRVVGNLPYNISSPILFHLLHYAADIEDQHVMLQKEVVDRLLASPGTRAYGRLSVMLQWAYAMERVLDVPPTAFHPPPRVDSSVLRMQPLPRARQAQVATYVNNLSEVVKVAFSQRRKRLRHTLGAWLDAKGLPVTIDLQCRAEEIPPADYWALAQLISSPQSLPPQSFHQTS
jgi:16S rRNA (adenine1518-N6/adenine1519-N6)-dimethyltransferase